MTATTARPATMPLNPAGLPDDPLLREARFVGWCWSWSEQKGKWDKPPLRLLDGQPASVTDKRDWATRARALAAVDRLGFDGIGLVLTAGCGVTGIDLDKCRDADTGEIADWARAIIDRFASYWEPSASGTGIRIFIRATLPPGRRRLGHIEMYDSGRYLTINGNPGPGASRHFEERQAELDAWHAETFPARPDPTPVHRGHPQREEGDAALLERARSARNGAKFSRLYDLGDWQAFPEYPSASEARQGLCSEIAFWCAGDPGRCERLFMGSALYTDERKWLRERAEVLRNAYNRREFFDWSRVAPPPPVSTLDTPPCADDAGDDLAELQALSHDDLARLALLRGRLADERGRRLDAIDELMVNPKLTEVEKVTAYVVVKAAAVAQERQPDDAPAELVINQKAIACDTGLSRQTIGKTLTRWTEQGYLRKEPRETGRFTAKGQPIKETVIRLPARGFTDNLVMAATWHRAPDAKQQGGNGQRSCPKCGGTKCLKLTRSVRVKTITYACATSGCTHVYADWETPPKEIAGTAETFIEEFDLAADISTLIDIPREQLAPIPPAPGRRRRRATAAPAPVSTVDTPPCPAVDSTPPVEDVVNAGTPPPRDYTISLVEAADRYRAATYGAAADD